MKYVVARAARAVRLFFFFRDRIAISDTLRVYTSAYKYAPADSQYVRAHLRKILVFCIFIERNLSAFRVFSSELVHACERFYV